MNTRASELIDLLNLEPHMEGGSFRQVYRSTLLVNTPPTHEERRALTTIYYLLCEGEYDSWHRVVGDEVWHYYEGAPIELYWIDRSGDQCNYHLLGEVGETSLPVAVVPGGCWQMARTTGDYTLVGCTVAPGFEMRDFQLLRDHPSKLSQLQRKFPDLAKYV